MTEPHPALAGLGVVYFGNDWYAENRTSSHHIAMRLAQRLPVLYVDSPGIRKPKASGRDFRRGLRKLAATLKKPQRLQDQLWHCTVPQLPFRRIPGVEAFNRVFSRWAVKRAARLAGIGRRVSWFVVPHPGFLAGRIGEELCVYYCTDNYAAFPGVDIELITARDRHLTETADVVFVAPPALVGAKHALNANTVFSPHGVDVDLFRSARSPSTPTPAAMRGIAGPVIGYIGMVHDWVNLDMIEWIAQQKPAWQFVFVGNAATDVGRLRALPNVHFMGPQPYPDLPQWSKSFDVAILPQRMNQWIANANPLKLREYLAAGLPVVSVRNPEIEKFSRWVHIADDDASFLRGIERALEQRDPEAAEERIAAVADQTWEARVDSVVGTLAEALVRRRSAPVT